MLISSWNVNSVRARIENIKSYLLKYKPDILMMQEIKTEDVNFPYDDFSSMDYESHVFGQKSYNGVAIISKGKLKNIEMYIDNKLIKNFQLVIDERLQEEETLDINILKMISIRIEDVKKLKNFLRVSVLFESEQIKFLKDKKGKIIDGDQKKSILVKDLWTFEKKIQSKDLNWILVETRDA